MREILFRGKRKDNGEWVYGSLLIQAGERINKDELTPAEYRILGCRGENHLVDPKTVGEYTGLTDGKGTKIFEHDIVRIYADLTTMRYVISYDKENARFVVGDTGFTFWSYIGTKIEVIGNVHDGGATAE